MPAESDKLAFFFYKLSVKLTWHNFCQKENEIFDT